MLGLDLVLEVSEPIKFNQRNYGFPFLKLHRVTDRVTYFINNFN